MMTFPVGRGKTAGGCVVGPTSGEGSFLAIDRPKIRGLSLSQNALHDLEVSLGVFHRNARAAPEDARSDHFGRGVFK